LICARLVGGIGLPTPVVASPISGGTDGFFPTPSPDPLRNRVHPLVRFAASSEFSHPYLPRARLSANLETRAQRARGAPSVGLPSLFATSACGIVVTKSQLRHLPSSAFRTPSTVSSATGLAGLFHPAATSRVPPFRDFPSQHSRIDSSSTRALSSVGLGRLRTVAHSRQLPRPRPQGFVPCQESVASTPVLPDAPPASLLGFLLLQVFPLQTVGDTFVPPSAHDLSEIS